MNPKEMSQEDFEKIVREAWDKKTAYWAPELLTSEPHQEELIAYIGWIMFQKLTGE